MPAHEVEGPAGLSPVPVLGPVTCFFFALPPLLPEGHGRFRRERYRVAVNGRGRFLLNGRSRPECEAEVLGEVIRVARWYRHRLGVREIRLETGQDCRWARVWIAHRAPLSLEPAMELWRRCCEEAWCRQVETVRDLPGEWRARDPVRAHVAPSLILKLASLAGGPSYYLN